MQSEHPLFRRFENELELAGAKGEPFPVEWTTIGRDFYLRPAEAEVGVVWRYFGRGNQDGLVKGSHIPTDVREQLNKVLASANFWRVWPLNDDECVFFRHKFFLFGFLDGERFARIEMPLPRPRNAHDCLHLKPNAVQSLVSFISEEELAEARPWIKNPTNACDYVDWNKGSRREFEQLMRGYALLFLPAQSRGMLRVDFPPFADDGRSNFSNVFMPSRNPGVSAYALTAFRALFADAFHVAPREFPKGYARNGYHLDFSIGIERAAPTAHERLEALLLWRDFLRGKMPDAEIEALLRPAAG